MDKPVPLCVPFCSTNVPLNVPTMEQAQNQKRQGLEVFFKTFVPFVPCFYTPLLEISMFYRCFSSVSRFAQFQQWGTK